MAQLIFTQQLARFFAVPQVDSTALVLRAALEQAFACQPRLRSYVLDEQGHLRANVVIFVDGQRIRERQLLGDALRADAKVYMAVPAFPAKPADSEDPLEWKVQQIWSLAAGGADQPGVLWAGTLPGGLFRSADYGESWQLVDALWQVPERAQWMGGGYDVPGIHSICVDPRDSNAVLVGISCGGAWLTTDGGVSWQSRAAGMRADYMPPELAEVQAVQDPHRIVRCAAEPDKLWCQHHNGIWRSVDNGAHWQEVRPANVSNFGFVTAVHPHDGETAWFVPASADSQRIPPQGALAVSRTTDGGHSFTAWRGGLPQQHCYDLVYRHGLAVSADGRLLLMGSTTGGVWLSEDGGGQWQTIAPHLPPVYAVGFA